MRLIRLCLHGVKGPIPRISIPMSSVSVLLGGNDSGKSSTLHAAAAFLNGVQPLIDDSEGDETSELSSQVGLGEGLQVEVSAGSREMLFAECLADLRGVDADTPRLTRTFQGRQLDQPIARDRPCVEQWRDVLVSAASESETDSGLLGQALDRSCVFELKPLQQDSNQLVIWEVHWCLPSDWSTTGETTEADEGAVEYVRFAPVGASVQTIPPAAVLLPVRFEMLEARMWACTNTLARWVGTERPQLTPVSKSSTETVSESGPKTVREVDLVTAYELLARLANVALPSWIREIYELEAIPSSRPDDGGNGMPIRELFAKRSDEESSFPVAELAAGHALWVQLAVLEACEILASLAERFWIYHLGYITTFFASSNPEIMGVWPWTTIDQAWSEYENLVDSVKRGDFDIPVPVSILDAVAILHGRSDHERQDEPAWANHDTFVSTLRTLSGSRLRSLLYIIDEPERHLHPCVQREAAQWLRDRMRERRTQALIATHSPAFLNPADDVEFLALRRSTRAGYRFDPVSIAACDELAGELGFDRGELLTRVEMFLFVEGITDELVLTELFGEDLARSRTCVVPIHGARKHQGAISAEALLRFTTAPASILLDNVPADITDQLLVDRNFRDEVRASGTRWAELQWIADIVETSMALKRSIRPLSIPTSDIFDLLDERLLHDAYPRFRSHERARVDLTVAQTRSEKRINSKAFRNDRYGIPNTIEPYRKVLPIMRARGIKPPALVRIMNELDLARLAGS
jgi:AAA domain, putative AbiEii toxin, Type IV TA system